MNEVKLKKPLYILAKKKTLPELQCIDKETIDWIRTNEIKAPQLNTNRNDNPSIILDLNLLLETTKTVFEKFLISGVPLQKEWFVNDKRPLSIHGELHIYRVAILAGIIASQYGKENIEKAIYAGLFHDISRANDQSDIGHGERSANWLVSHRNLINLDNEGFDEVIDAINNHEQLPFGIEPRSATAWLQAADALDRFRLPKLKWWPNYERMQYKPDSLLIKFAYDLIILSEERAIDCTDQFEVFKLAFSDLTNKMEQDL